MSANLHKKYENSSSETHFIEDTSTQCLLTIATTLLASLLNKYGSENSDDLINDAVRCAKKLINKCNE